MNFTALGAHVKRHGFWRTGVTYSMGLVKRVVDFDVMRVERYPPGPPVRETVIEPYETRRLTAEEYEEGIEALGGDVSGHRRKWAFDRGDRCFANCLDGRLVGYTFFATEPTIYRPGLMLRFPEGYTYSYASHTEPKHRGRRLSPARSNLRRHVDYRQGVAREVLWTVSLDNAASAASSRRDRPELVGYLGYLNVRGRFYCFATPGCRREGIGLAAERG